MSDYGDDFENYEDENFEVNRVLLPPGDMVFPIFLQAKNITVNYAAWVDLRSSEARRNHASTRPGHACAGRGCGLRGAAPLSRANERKPTEGSLSCSATITASGGSGELHRRDPSHVRDVQQASVR